MIAYVQYWVILAFSKGIGEMKDLTGKRLETRIYAGLPQNSTFIQNFVLVDFVGGVSGRSAQEQTKMNAISELQLQEAW